MIDLINFQKNFFRFKNKNILLYGIGIKTKELVENISFNFVGLMDKDPNNIGKILYGLEIVSNERALNIGDLIIIVSGDVYYNIIYERIKNFKIKFNIPIYFCNGEEAKDLEINSNIKNNLYWKQTLYTLKKEIIDHDIISFDIFDTLITRKIVEPTDLFSIIQNKLFKDDDFVKCRINTEISIGNSASLEKIYEHMPNKFSSAYELELDLEMKSIILRKDIIDALNYAIKQNKEIYLISDTYHSKDFIKKILNKFSIEGYKDILISCELNKRKSDDSLWKLYKKLIGNSKALHIGDNIKSDIYNPKKFNIDTFYIMNPYTMLNNSIINTISPKICTVDESIILGSIISKIFNSPFSLAKTKGIPKFSNLNDIGYTYYGPILFTYIVWILKETIQIKTEKILFIARDGYFLKKLYDFLVKKLYLEDFPESEYLLISRTIATVLNLNNDKDLEETMKIKFTGTLKDYFLIRFGIEIPNLNKIITMPQDIDTVSNIVYKYKNFILNNAKKQQTRYLKYFNKIIDKNTKISIVEPSYNGTIQFLLSKFLERDIIGYYCNANLSSSNKYYKDNNMKAIFQSIFDQKAIKSNIRKHTVFFENGILVAPTGSPLAINSDLTFKFASNNHTQNNFIYKEELFKGVLEFFNDMSNIYSSLDEISLTPEFIDFIVGEIFTKTKIIKKIKDTFFYDSLYEEIYDRKIFE